MTAEREFEQDGLLISEVLFRPDDGFPLCLGYMVGKDDGRSWAMADAGDCNRSAQSLGALGAFAFLGGRVKPVLYIDVDGVLLRHPDSMQFGWDRTAIERYYAENPGGGPPTDVAEFLTWARDEFECRWLTAWTCSGHMPDDVIARIADHIRVSPDLLRGMDNPMSWATSKTEGIDWSRDWYWLDDDAHVIEREVTELRRRGERHRLITVDTSRRADALLCARSILKTMRTITLLAPGDRP